MFRLLVLALSLQALISGYGCVDIPSATLDLNGSGLTISIPAWDSSVSLCAFHVNNVNKQFYGKEAGDYAVDVTSPRDGRWVWTFPGYSYSSGDTIYYWIYCISNGLGFEKLGQSYHV